MCLLKRIFNFLLSKNYFVHFRNVPETGNFYSAKNSYGSKVLYKVYKNVKIYKCKVSS